MRVEHKGYGHVVFNYEYDEWSSVMFADVPHLHVVDVDGEPLRKEAREWLTARGVQISENFE